MFFEDIELCNKLSEFGSRLVAPNSNILTHCNTGGLATVGVGTAIGVIRKAHESGKKIKVWVDETRPLLQGGRLTAWEMGELGVPYQLICDSMAAMLMARGEVDCIFVGADRIAANGDFANKIGTYTSALAAKAAGIPFYVAAPTATIDWDCLSGEHIPIEERSADEVCFTWGWSDQGEFMRVRTTPKDSTANNPAFDVTPANLITGIITEKGIFKPDELVQLRSKGF